MKTKVLIGGIFIGVFIIILLILEALYLYRAMGPGTLVIGHITLAMFIVYGTGINLRRLPELSLKFLLVTVFCLKLKSDVTKR